MPTKTSSRADAATTNRLCVGWPRRKRRCRQHCRVGDEREHAVPDPILQHRLVARLSPCPADDRADVGDAPEPADPPRASAGPPRPCHGALRTAETSSAAQKWTTFGVPNALTSWSLLRRPASATMAITTNCSPVSARRRADDDVIAFPFIERGQGDCFHHRVLPEKPLRSAAAARPVSRLIHPEDNRSQYFRPDRDYRRGPGHKEGPNLVNRDATCGVRRSLLLALTSALRPPPYRGIDRGRGARGFST